MKSWRIRFNDFGFDKLRVHVRSKANMITKCWMCADRKWCCTLRILFYICDEYRIRYNWDRCRFLVQYCFWKMKMCYNTILKYVHRSMNKHFTQRKLNLRVVISSISIILPNLLHWTYTTRLHNRRQFLYFFHASCMRNEGESLSLLLLFFYFVQSKY